VKNSPYFKQVQLLLRCLPEVEKEKCFSLKGGTALNLFVRELPRLSVDIDLAFLPTEPWNDAIVSVESSLQKIVVNIQKSIKDVKIHPSKNSSTNLIEKLFISQPGAQIKIEPNPVIRGSVYQSREMNLVGSASELFQMDVTMNVLSLADLYGGKLVAALDRQHPRDLFDTKLLLDEEGLTSEIRKAFVIYLASHARPMHEIIRPTLHDRKAEFEKEFEGMTSIPFSYDDFESTRSKLIEIIDQDLTGNERNFLVSIQKGVPDWGLIDIADAEQLPALQWKIQNVQKMSEAKREKTVMDLKIKLDL
jgi:predicted nucleotidyltransferase component of viral defense system